jgi:hypothetical protein
MKKAVSLILVLLFTASIAGQSNNHHSKKSNKLKYTQYTYDVRFYFPSSKIKIVHHLYPYSTKTRKKIAREIDTSKNKLFSKEEKEAWLHSKIKQTDIKLNQSNQKLHGLNKYGIPSYKDLVSNKPNRIWYMTDYKVDFEKLPTRNLLSIKNPIFHKLDDLKYQHKVRKNNRIVIPSTKGGNTPHYLVEFRLKSKNTGTNNPEILVTAPTNSQDKSPPKKKSSLKKLFTRMLSFL